MTQSVEQIDDKIQEYEKAIKKLKTEREILVALGPDIFDGGTAIRVTYDYTYNGVTKRSVGLMVRNHEGIWHEARANSNPMGWPEVVRRITTLHSGGNYSNVVIEVSKEWRPFPGLPTPESGTI